MLALQNPILCIKQTQIFKFSNSKKMLKYLKYCNSSFNGLCYQQIETVKLLSLCTRKCSLSPCEKRRENFTHKHTNQNRRNKRQYLLFLSIKNIKTTLECWISKDYMVLHCLLELSLLSSWIWAVVLLDESNEKSQILIVLLESPVIKVFFWSNAKQTRWCKHTLK
jgi:hypothetical protein